MKKAQKLTSIEQCTFSSVCNMNCANHNITQKTSYVQVPCRFSVKDQDSAGIQRLYSRIYCGAHENEHSSHELNNVMSMQKVKTQPCYNFCTSAPTHSWVPTTQTARRHMSIYQTQCRMIMNFYDDTTHCHQNHQHELGDGCKEPHGHPIT